MRLSILLSLLLSAGLSAAEEPATGPIIEHYGPTFPLHKTDIPVEAGTRLRAVFDVADDPSKNGDPNPKLISVARFLNMHGRSGVARDQMELVVVLHGRALANALTQPAHARRFGGLNHNERLLGELKQAGVRFIACGQSLGFRDVAREDLNPAVEVGLSAMTVLTTHQMRGFALLP